MRRIGARPLAFLNRILGLGVQPFDGEHEAARRGVHASAFIGEARINEAIGDHHAQIIRRLRLHAGGNFLGEEFKQEFRHG